MVGKDESRDYHIYRLILHTLNKPANQVYNSQKTIIWEH
jgi:hypothetical protein